MPAKCSEERSRFPLDTIPLALPARHDTTSRRYARVNASLVRGRNSLNTRCLVFTVRERGAFPFPYPTKPVQFEGREVGVVVTPPVAVEPRPVWQDSPGRDAAVAVVVREGRCSARSSSSSRYRRLAESSLLLFYYYCCCCCC